MKTALCDLGVGVSVMPFSLYKRLDLNKLTPTEIYLQMADKSTARPVGICEDVPVVVANITILTNFVILDIPEDDSMSIILGRPFLNTAGAVIDCTKGNVTFHVNGNEHTVHFPRKQPQVHSINSQFHRLLLEVLNFLYLLSRRNMIFLLLGMCISPLR